MLPATSSAAPQFNLRPANTYFSSQDSLALLEAALRGDITAAQKLARAGANPNDNGPKDKKVNRISLLHYAVAANNKDAVRVLIESGADPEASLQGFGSPLAFAVTLNNRAMLSAMLEHRPPARIDPRALQRLLFQAASRASAACLELLLDRGVPIDLKDGAGYTILLRVMDAQEYDLAEWLVRRGASVKIETPSGMTPAYSVQHDLEQFAPGTETHRQLLALKALMQGRGAEFPAVPPDVVREQRGAR